MSGNRYANDADRIHRNVTADPATGCWNWRLSLFQDGYGKLTVGSKTWLAHRFSYEVFTGPIPDGLQIDHLCRNRRCVNPEHLEAVTGRENLMRSPIHWAPLNAAKTHCISGHEFNDTNTRVRRGARFCRPCQSAASTRYKQRKMLRAAGISSSERAA